MAVQNGAATGTQQQVNTIHNNTIFMTEGKKIFPSVELYSNGRHISKEWELEEHHCIREIVKYSMYTIHCIGIGTHTLRSTNSRNT